MRFAFDQEPFHIVPVHSIRSASVELGRFTDPINVLDTAADVKHESSIPWATQFSALMEMKIESNAFFISKFLLLQKLSVKNGFTRIDPDMIGTGR